MTMSKKTIIYAALAVLALAAPFIVHPLLAMQILCFSLFAASFNLMAGYLGLISFGHASFFGLAAYVSGYAVKVWHLPTGVGILLATGVAMVLALVIGALSVRRHGVYFAMITMAMAQLVYFYTNKSPWTGGEDGMPGIPRGSFLGFIDLTNNIVMYGFVLFITMIGFAIIYRAVNSPFGILMQAIRDNEDRVTSLGYNVFYVKLLAFTLSGTLAGLAGGTKAIVFQFASESDIVWGMSGVPVLATLIGGIGTLPGPLIGGAIMVGLEHGLSNVGQWVFFIQGAIFVLVVMFFRRGIYGEIHGRFIDKDRKSGKPPKS